MSQMECTGVYSLGKVFYLVLNNIVKNKIEMKEIL